MEESTNSTLPTRRVEVQGVLTPKGKNKRKARIRS
jgi:hypothetical protein